MNQFATNLKTKRLELGWSQEQAVMHLSIAHGKKFLSKNVEKSNYQAWEHGRSYPRIDMIITIVEVFKVDDMYLFLNEIIRAA